MRKLNTSNANPDYLLVHRCLLGDKDAEYELFAGVYASGKKYIWSRTQNTNLAEQDKEDILQEVMQITYEKLERYNGTSAFSSFVIGIAYNVILAHQRKGKRRSAKTVNIDELPENVIPFAPAAYESANPLVILIKKEEQSELADAISRLSDDHRQLLTYWSNGMTFKELAKLSGKTEDAIYSMFYRAIKSLKKIFEIKPK